MEMMKGRRTNSRVAEFGEIVMFKIPKTKLNPGKFEDQWDAGVYLGFDMRSTESLIGTPVGVSESLTFEGVRCTRDGPVTKCLVSRAAQNSQC